MAKTDYTFLVGNGKTKLYSSWYVYQCKNNVCFLKMFWKDPCAGDSGGPLMIKDEHNIYTIIGTTSVGYLLIFLHFL